MGDTKYYLNILGYYEIFELVLLEKGKRKISRREDDEETYDDSDKYEIIKIFLDVKDTEDKIGDILWLNRDNIVDRDTAYLQRKQLLKRQKSTTRGCARGGNSGDRCSSGGRMWAEGPGGGE